MRSKLRSNQDRSPLEKSIFKDLCRRCATIDFDKVFKTKSWRSLESKHIMNLPSPAQLEASRCPLCNLLGAMAPDIGFSAKSRSEKCQLRIYSAQWIIFGQVGKELYFDDTAVLGVFRRVYDEVGFGPSRSVDVADEQPEDLCRWRLCYRRGERFHRDGLGQKSGQDD